jgi:beta-lactamase class A
MNPAAPLQPGKAYSVEKLIEHMIHYSDNRSYSVLKEFLAGSNYEPVYRVYDHLGFPPQKFANDGDNISPKEYARTFIELFDGSYLNASMSARALKLLKKASFPQGILAGLPQKTVIAEKYGERGYTDSDLKQLHDCGIVYSPGEPYVLCIMTKGNDWHGQAKAIQHISHKVFEAMQGN